jgi:hypothetical protein
MINASARLLFSKQRLTSFRVQRSTMATGTTHVRYENGWCKCWKSSQIHGSLNWLTARVWITQIKMAERGQFRYLFFVTPLGNSLTRLGRSESTTLKPFPVSKSINIKSFQPVLMTTEAGTTKPGATKPGATEPGTTKTGKKATEPGKWLRMKKNTVNTVY